MSDSTLKITSKACSKCKQIKDLSMFSKNKSGPNGYNCQCKLCAKIYRQQNKDKIRIARKAYYHQNKDKMRIVEAAYKRDHRKRHRGSIHYALSSLVERAKQRAKRDNLPFDLTIEWLRAMVVSHCPITLQPIDWTKEQVVNGNAGPNSPSIDKVKPELGYVQSNCAIVSFRGNAIKSNGTIDEHRRVVQYMAAQQLRDIEL